MFPPVLSESLPETTVLSVVTPESLAFITEYIMSYNPDRQAWYKTSGLQEAMQISCLNNVGGIQGKVVYEEGVWAL